ncbi:MAG: lysophospholipid acyltransferase family protein [Pseudomonadota bacterium]
MTADTVKQQTLGSSGAVSRGFRTVLGVMRGLTRLALFAVLTVPLMPLQAVFVALDLPAARRLPCWYHGWVARIFGVTIRREGRVAPDVPLLLVANHTSWLDIIIVSAVAPVSFVAKAEIKRWPFVGWLAQLQRTIFIDRTRRRATQDVARALAARLRAGDTVLFFPEGTIGDGNRILPFKSSLFASVRPRAGAGSGAADAGEPLADLPADTHVQTIVLAYTHLSGLPLGRGGRARFAWLGGENIARDVWRRLTGAPLDVVVRAGAPAPLTSFADRKELARAMEAQISRDLGTALRPPRRSADHGHGAATATAASGAAVIAPDVRGDGMHLARPV